MPPRRRKFVAKLQKKGQRRQVRSWETRASFEGRDADGPPNRDGFWESEREPMDPLEATGDEAGALLCQFLLDMHLSGNLSAKSLCVICWFASRAGASGADVASDAYRQNAQSGHFQRHLDTCLGINMRHELSWRYRVHLPSSHKHDLSRTSHETLVTCPHEAMATEVSKDPSILERVSTTHWPHLYWQNPIVRDSAEPVIPMALYLDGVPTTNRDGALGFWMYNLITLKRTLVAVLRKSYLCACGCSGWCSLHPIWVFLRWSLEAMARGVYPDHRHDFEPWMDSCDSNRSSLAGSPLGYKAVLLQIKGDWLEFSSSLGFMNWMSQRFPCIFCSSTKESLYNFTGFSPGCSAHIFITSGDYDHACQDCEKVVSLNEDQWRRVCNKLHYFKGKKGPAGRALLDDDFATNLRKHDRLEPDLYLQDIGRYDDIDSFPAQCTFWRATNQTRVRRRCPIFCDALGTSVDNLCVDLLHAFFLGPLQEFCSGAIWYCIDNDVFNCGGTSEARVVTNCLHLRVDLLSYYTRFRAAHPNRTLTRVEDFTAGMIGAFAKGAQRRSLSFKAAETKDLLPWCVELLDRYQPGGSLHIICVFYAYVGYLTGGIVCGSGHPAAGALRVSESGVRPVGDRGPGREAQVAPTYASSGQDPFARQPYALRHMGRRRFE